jgi:MFS family permease
MMKPMPEQSESPSKLSVFRALDHRNYRLYFSGQCISLIGTWMQQLAMSWLVYRLTGSVLFLGILGFTSQGPGALLAPFAGTFADRCNRHHLILLTQSLATLQAFALAYLALSGQVKLWHVIALSIFYGLVNALDVPVRQSFVVDMLEKKEDLSNAIALNSTIFNMARLVGPSIAGITISLVGEGMCFLLNGISFLAVIAALLAMKFNRKPPPPKQQGILEGLKEGIDYAYHSVPIRSILMMMGLLCLIGLPYTVMMPAFAREVLHGGAHTLGFLMGASGAGALTGAIFLAFRRNVTGLGRWIGLSVTMLGLGLICFSFSNILWLSLLLELPMGFGMIVAMASCNITIQTLVEEDKRGRVMSLFAMSFMAMMPIGSLLYGIAGRHLGIPITLRLAGALALLLAITFASRLASLKEFAYPNTLQKGIFPGHH